MFLFKGEKQNAVENHLKFEEGMFDMNDKSITMVYIFCSCTNLSFEI